jgi:hypothetical protein
MRAQILAIRHLLEVLTQPTCMFYNMQADLHTCTKKKVRDHQRRTPTDDSHDHEIVYRWQTKKMAQKIE